MASNIAFSATHPGRSNWPSWVVMLVTGGLTLLGLCIIYSVTQARGGADPLKYLKLQLIWLIPAFFAGYAMRLLPLEKLRRWTPLIMFICVVLCVLVLIPGVGLKINGARRWIGLGPMRMQVSDFVKLGLVYVLADYLANNRRVLSEFKRGLVIPCAILGVACVLTILQPDVGTTLLMASVGGAMLFVAGVRILPLIPVALLGVAVVTVKVINDPERLDRITSFLNIEGSKDAGGYQLYQGIIGLCCGGLSGVGLGNGGQKHAFLPEAHTDFIFSTVGEELGFIGTSSVVLAFLVLFLTCMWNMRRATDLFHFLICLGALLFVTIQACINLGVNSALLPTKGMSLPFVSYGGSNLVCMFACIGLILNCFNRWNNPALTRPRDFAVSAGEPSPDISAQPATT